MQASLKRTLIAATIVFTAINTSQGAEILNRSEVQPPIMTVVFPVPTVKLDFRQLAEKAAYYCSYSCAGSSTQIMCTGDSGKCACFCANGQLPKCDCKN